MSLLTWAFARSIDASAVEVARLNRKPYSVLARVVIPLSLPGITLGGLLVFVAIAVAAACYLCERKGHAALGLRDAGATDWMQGRQRLAAIACLAVVSFLSALPIGMLLDEPFTSLDLPLRQEMLELLLAFQEKSGFALLHVTHDPEEARRVAERVILLDAGRIAWEGNTRDLDQGGIPALDRLATAMAWWRQDNDKA